jgi:hypothetical protein
MLTIIHLLTLPLSLVGTLNNGGSQPNHLFVQALMTTGENDSDGGAATTCLLRHSALQPNDVLLSVNEENLDSEKEDYWQPTQVAQWLRDTPSEVSIVVRRPIAWQKKEVSDVRRSAVGQPLLDWVTPPPVRVLFSACCAPMMGTACEAPEKVTTPYDDKLKDNKETGDFVVVDTYDAKDAASLTDTPTSTDASQRETLTVKRRVKNFGRQYLFPF